MKTAPNRTVYNPPPPKKKRAESHRVIPKIEKPLRGAVLHREKTWKLPYHTVSCVFRTAPRILLVIRTSPAVEYHVAAEVTCRVVK